MARGGGGPGEGRGEGREEGRGGRGGQGGRGAGRDGGGDAAAGRGPGGRVRAARRWAWVGVPTGAGTSAAGLGESAPQPRRVSRECGPRGPLRPALHPGVCPRLRPGACWRRPPHQFHVPGLSFPQTSLPAGPPAARPCQASLPYPTGRPAGAPLTVPALCSPFPRRAPYVPRLEGNLIPSMSTREMQGFLHHSRTSLEAGSQAGLVFRSGPAGLRSWGPSPDREDPREGVTCEGALDGGPQVTPGPYSASTSHPCLYSGPSRPLCRGAALNELCKM